MLKSIELAGFKSFARKTTITMTSPVVAIVGPNGSGKSNTAEAFRFVLGEQSFKSLRSKKGEDLIWAGSRAVPRANRASVKVTFRNEARLLDIDFDEVVIERVVHRDGTNEYFINGTRVRLKDVTALLAGANIGASGHHIISQGEADRILLASPLQRREMLEDALGLRIFHYRKAESLRKLEKTKTHMQEVQATRRELLPRLQFLERLVAKKEKIATLKEALREKLATYLAAEEAFLQHRRQTLTQALKAPQEKKQAIARELAALKEKQEQSSRAADADPFAEKMTTLRQEIAELRQRQQALLQEMGKLTGQLELLQAQGRAGDSGAVGERITIAPKVIIEPLRAMRTELAIARKQTDPTLLTQTIAQVHRRISAVLEEVESLQTRKDTPADLSRTQRRITELATIVKEMEEKNARYQKQLANKQKELEALREQSLAHRQRRQTDALTEAKLAAELQEVEMELRLLREQEAQLNRRQRLFEESVQEAVALLGAQMPRFSAKMVAELPAEEMQEKRRREIERLKIQLEQLGVVDEAALEEYADVKDRVAFLEKELHDLTEAHDRLQRLLQDIETELRERFRAGLVHINSTFTELFQVLFGGGSAELVLVAPNRTADADAEVPEGVEIRVSIPRKKASTLEVLSGGERALTSIALIFAMSQVNPPPFLILDETDAALDEANSRRYAEMVRRLAEKSQLILITHNRETMAAAGELYGITMGADGVSHVLSVKLEEAQAVAK